MTKPNYGIHTVEFDPSRVTETVKAEIKKNVMLIQDIDKNHCNQVYDSAIRSVIAGRDLFIMSNDLMQMNINGLTKKRAGQIAYFLNNIATAVIQRERQQSLGITKATWMYSGAPCEINPKKPLGQQNESHKAANGKKYKVNEGMYLDGKYTWPGYENGCKCVSKSIIPALSK